MLLQAALNGRRTKADHPAVPVSLEELQRDAVACEQAGAHGFHVHPRDHEGLERLEPEVVDAAATAVHDVSRWPVSVSTGAWIEGDQHRRQMLVTRWHGPDSATVNVSEEGSFDTMRALLGQGIKVEAGVWTAQEAEALIRSGLCDWVERVLVELIDVAPGDVEDAAGDVHRLLDRAQVIAPRLQHGEEASAWPALEDALRRHVDTRIGLEDVLVLPDGTRAADNAALVAAAADLGAGR